MAASAIQPEEPSRLQLSLIDGHEEAIPAPAQISPAEPTGDELRAAAGLPPLVMPEWEHKTLIDAMRDRGGRKKPAAKPKASLEEIQRTDAALLSLHESLGRNPTSAELKAAGLEIKQISARQRLKKIKGLGDAELVELQRDQVAAGEELKQALETAKAEKAGRSQLTSEEAEALKGKRGCDDKRIAGITRIREASDLPEGFRHWGEHADKLIPCDSIPWTCASGRVVIQINPETPPLNESGRPMKYLFPKGCGGLVGVLAGSEQLVLDPEVPLVIVEGTYQGRAVATALEGSSNPYAVVQVSGCDGWMTGGAPSPEFAHVPLRGREVFFLPDADVKSNRGVYDAAKYLRENLLDEYLAKDVRIVHLPGRGNDGADDILRRHSQEHNQEMVLRWLDKARGPEGKLSNKPPRKPRRASAFFSEQGQFQPLDFWQYLQQKHHLALNGDKAIALYEGGVYLNSDSRRWHKAVEEALGNDFVPQYLNTVSEIGHSSLKVSGREVPTFLKEPWLNVSNCLVDLRTGEIREHTPEVVTTTQLPIEWDPTAKCPTWEALIEEALPGQLERLEDVISQALDWTRSPTKILLLYGASRAGKGLILRVLEQLMGRGNYSAVTLHQLAENRFMVAELHGKRANIAGELKPEEVKDISAVKMLTGEDPIQADKKYGATFTFYSYAFLAFSCNKLPPVNETTKAFTSRVAPFRFTKGYDGCEDLTLGAKLSAELPGILARLVKAWQRRQERGTFIPVDEATRAHFDENIDHVARFLSECTVRLDSANDGMRRSDLFPLWLEWCSDQNLLYAAKTSKQTFHEKVRNQGVNDGKDRKGIYRWPLKVRDGDSDTDGTDEGPKPAVNANDGKKPAVNEEKPAVAKSTANTGDSAKRRQRRQPSGKTTADEKTTAEKPSPDLPTSPKVTERYGQGCQKVAVIAVTPPSDRLVVPGSTDPLIVDLETHSADLLWSGPANGDSFIRLVGTDHGNNISPLALGGHKGPLVAHNGFGFDFLALARHHQLPLLKLSEEGRLVDTMVMALALDPPEPPKNSDGRLSGGQIAKLYSLDKCAARAGVSGKTDDLSKLAFKAARAAGHGKNNQLTNEIAAIGYGLIPQGDPDYNAYLRGDIAATRGVLEHLCPSGELTPYIRREMKIMGRLAAGITLAGTRLDVELCQQRFDEVEAQKAVCRESLINRYGLPTTTADGREASNPLGCKGAAEAITAAAKDLGLELPTTKTGKPSTSKENLRPLLEEAMAAGNSEQVAFFETILGLTGARSVYGTALANLQQDGRIHPRVSPLQTSGRFSITDPGITVFGKRGGRVTERAIFLPDNDDHVLIACDLSQIDMRAVAAHSQDPAYLELFTIDPATGKGRDAHSEVAAAIGFTREDAKAIGHGWNYGMSTNRMAQEGIEPRKAQEFDRKMRKAFPKLVAWRDRVRAAAEKGRRLDNGFGRMMRPNPDRAWTQGPALMGQGTARDLMMEAVLRLPLELVPQLRFLVHDELVFSVPADSWESARDQILEAMTFEWAPPGAALSVTVTGDASRPGRNWAECYAK